MYYYNIEKILSSENVSLEKDATILQMLQITNLGVARNDCNNEPSPGNR